MGVRKRVNSMVSAKSNSSMLEESDGVEKESETTRVGNGAEATAAELSNFKKIADAVEKNETEAKKVLKDGEKLKALRRKLFQEAMRDVVISTALVVITMLVTHGGIFDSPVVRTTSIITPGEMS